MFIYKELNFRDFPKIIFQAVIGTTIIMFLVGAANVFGWLLTNLQIPHHVGAFVASLTSSPILFLLAMNVLLLIIGTMVNASAAVVILTPIFLPMLAHFGIDPVAWGIMMIVNVEIGFLTFPFGLNLFVAMGITGKHLTTIARAVLPFLVLLFICLLMVTYIPVMSTWLPSALK